MSPVAIKLKRVADRLMSVQTLIGVTLLIASLYLIIGHQDFQKNPLSEAVTPMIYIFGDIPFYVLGIVGLITLVISFVKQD